MGFQLVLKKIIVLFILFYLINVGCESDLPLAQYSQLYSPESSQPSIDMRSVTIAGGSQGAPSCRSSIADSDSEMECSTAVSATDKQVCVVYI